MTIFAVVVATTVLVYGLGLVAYRAVLPTGGLAEGISVAPLLSLGTIYVVGTGALVLHVPLNGLTVAIAAVAVVGAAVARVRWSGGRVPAGSTRPSAGRPWVDELRNVRSQRPELRTALGAGLLAVAVIAGATTVGLAFVGHAVTPPAIDSVAHGFMTARIAATHSLDTPKLWLVYDHPASVDTSFYPLAMHALAATIVGLTGGSVGSVLIVIIGFFATVVLPIGVFTLTRTGLGDPVVAGLAAVFAVAIPLFPFSPFAWGGLTLIVGMAVVPGAAPPLARALLRRSWSGCGLITLCFLGLFGTHTSEIVTMLILLGLMTLQALVADAAPGRRLVRAVARLGLCGVLTLLLVAPYLRVFLTQTGAGVGYGGVPTAGLLASVGSGLVLRGNAHNGPAAWPGVWFGAAALAGLAICVWDYRRRSIWVVGFWLVFFLLFLGVAVSYDPLSQLLATAWYRHPDRVAYNLVLPTCVFDAVFIVGVFDRLSAGLSERRSSEALLATAALATATAVVASWAVIRPHLGATLAATEPVQSNERAAFRYLAEHTNAGDEVLNDEFREGSAWMYSLDRVMPVFQLQPVDWHLWDDRAWLAAHVNEAGSNAEVDNRLAALHVRYVYYGDQVFYDGGNRLMNLARLRSAPGLQEVFDRPGAHVFAVRAAAERG